MSEKQLIRLSNITGIGLMVHLERGDTVLGPLLIHAKDHDEFDSTEVEDFIVRDRMEVFAPCVFGFEYVTWQGQRIPATTRAAEELARLRTDSGDSAIPDSAHSDHEIIPLRPR